MLPEGFEPTIPVIELPETYALDRTVTGIGSYWNLEYVNVIVREKGV